MVIDFGTRRTVDKKVRDITARYKASNWSYGKSIFNNEDRILEALEGNLNHHSIGGDF